MSFAIDTKIQRWGNGLGLRVSGLMRDIPHFEQNMPVRVEITKDGFTVKKTQPTLTSLPFSEEELLASLNPSTAHSDLVSTTLNSEWIE
jgi:antitoxin MazE